MKMKNLKLSIYLLSIVLLLACSTTKQTTQSAKKDDGKIDFTFLQLNDVYEIAPVQGGEFGGMARVQTLHQELIDENPNTFMFLAGDFLNPSLLGTLKVDGQRILGKQMVDVMNAMNFDLVTFGNHEFDISQDALQERLNESNFDWVSGNVKLKTAKGIEPFYKMKNGGKFPIAETYIKKFSDADGTKLKIGFISVTLPSNPKDYVAYGDVFIKAKASYNRIKDSVDVVFGLTHVKISEDLEIAKLLPNLPLIMGGHEHTNSNHFVGEVQVSKADANAKTVYVHKISFDKKTKKTTVTSKLKEINKAIPSEKTVGEVVDKWQAILKINIEKIIENPTEIIYTTSLPLDGRDTPIRSTQTNLGKMVAEAMSFSFNHQVDGALVNGGSIRIDDELMGPINAIDIFRVLPFGGSILKVELKGSLLKRVLDYGKKAAGTGAYLQRHQFSFVNGVWKIKDREIMANMTYTVAFSDYLLKGYDIPFLSDKNAEVVSIYQPTEKEMAFDIRKAIVSFLKTQTKKER
jgi:2',3'-cyclic-nucleotide 2'-phosphodiesterase (5'-nucleotidase family)